MDSLIKASKSHSSIEIYEENHKQNLHKAEENYNSSIEEGRNQTQLGYFS